MSKISPIKFILPGLFLLVLGAGNIYIGSSKVNEYQNVLIELEKQQPSNFKNTSPLKRLRLAEQSADRIYQRLGEAKNRISFYQLVVFGGKCFFIVGIILLLTSLFMKKSIKKEVIKESPEKESDKEKATAL